MDVAVDEVTTRSPSSEDSNRDSATSAPSCSAESQSPPSPSESKCRKSSRIKAKMSKLEAEAASAKDNEKYNLRLSSLVKRVQVERRKSAPKEPKGKSKPPPLSKYRRRTANARERMRMKDINEGFEQLRSCLPEIDESDEQGKQKKLTKYMILNHALNYIHALRDILGYAPISEAGSSSAGTSEESDLGSDAASTRTPSESSSPSSADEMCSNPSPSASAVADLKDFACNGPPPVSTVHLKDLACYAEAMAGPSGLGFRDNVTCSSPSLSDPSLSPSPPLLPLPDDCMDIDESSLCPNVPIPLSTLEECMGIL